MKRLIIVFAALLALTVLYTNASYAEEGRHSLGLQAGQVLLSGDVASSHSNALGYGLFFSYASSDFLEFELGYLTSRHTGTSYALTQSSYYANLIYNVDQFDVLIPYLNGGAEFVSHDQEFNVGSGTKASASSSGFGLDFGFGVRVDFAKNLIGGLGFTYHHIFDVSVTPPGAATSSKAIQSYSTVMLRIGYLFDVKK